MKLYELAVASVIGAILLFHQVPAGSMALADIWYPVAGSVCILLAMVCIGAEVFQHTMLERIQPLRVLKLVSLPARAPGSRRTLLRGDKAFFDQFLKS